MRAAAQGCFVFLQIVQGLGIDHFMSPVQYADSPPSNGIAAPVSQLDSSDPR
jgi:hypothetical protein